MIKINEHYAVDVDRYNYILVKNEHRKDKKGNDVYKTIGYYKDLKSAFAACAEWCAASELSESEYSLKEAIEIVKSTYEKFEKLLKEVFEDD